MSERGLDAAKRGHCHKLQMTYWVMACLLYEEGRPHQQLQAESNKARLQELARQGFSRVLVLGGCCETCDKLNGKKFTIAEALEKMFLPQSKCQRGWCVCDWGVDLNSFR